MYITHHDSLWKDDGVGIKVFVDCAFSMGPMWLDVGSVIRGPSCQALETFMCSVFIGLQVLRRGCLCGLRRAWDVGSHQVKVFCDVAFVVEGLQNGDTDSNENNVDLFGLVCDLLWQQWQVEIQVIRRGHNVHANALAR